MNCEQSGGKMARVAALRTRPERTSTKSDQRNFALLGFSEVQLPNHLRHQGLSTASCAPGALE
jgi:hypothetical protein